VLTSGTNIPQASTETGALINRGGTPRVEHQVYGLSGAFRRLRRRQSEQSPLPNVERPAAAYYSPSILKGLVEKRTTGPQQRLRTPQIGLYARVLAQRSPRPNRNLGSGQAGDEIDRVTGDAGCGRTSRISQLNMSIQRCGLARSRK
jgi:hypothetical protein